MIDKDMKKHYIEPTLTIFTFTANTTIMVGSTAEIANEDASDEYVSGDGNSDARENNIFDNNHSIWDNAW
jgi:hypothetical protein